MGNEFFGRQQLKEAFVDGDVLTYHAIHRCKKRIRSNLHVFGTLSLMSAQSLLHRIDDILDGILGNGVKQTVDAAKMQVKRLSIDIGLTRNRADGDFAQVLLLKKLLERGKDRLARTHHAAVDAHALFRFYVGHRNHLCRKRYELRFLC